MVRIRPIKSSILITIILSFVLIDSLEAQFSARKNQRRHRSRIQNKMDIDNVLINLDELSERSKVLQEKTHEINMNILDNKNSDGNNNNVMALNTNLREIAMDVNNLVGNIKIALQDETIIINKSKKKQYIYLQYDIEAAIFSLERAVNKLNKINNLEN